MVKMLFIMVCQYAPANNHGLIWPFPNHVVIWACLYPRGQGLLFALTPARGISIYKCRLSEVVWKFCNHSANPSYADAKLHFCFLTSGGPPENYFQFELDRILIWLWFVQVKLSLHSKTSNFAPIRPVLKNVIVIWHKHKVYDNYAGLWFYDADNKTTLSEGQSIFSWGQ